MWGSYDFGRTWFLASTLLGPCSSASSRGLIYNGAVYLVCAGILNSHGAQDASHEPTYVSTDPPLATASWTTLSDGCQGCSYFNVERMAVPFDGVGTLMLINSYKDNYVYWQSATGNLQRAMQPSPIAGQWTAFRPAGTGATFSAPWSQRAGAATAIDAEGLLLVMTGGYFGGTYYGDAWQLSWQSDAANPIVYQLTSAAGFGQRDYHAMYAVHDWLFVYGGYRKTVPAQSRRRVDERRLRRDVDALRAVRHGVVGRTDHPGSQHCQRPHCRPPPVHHRRQCCGREGQRRVGGLLVRRTTRRISG